VYRQYAANLSVHFGQAKDPAQMQEIENLTLFDNTDFAQLERVITVTTPGTYYFGFYAYGMVQYFMFIDDFELHKGDVSSINENANLVDNFVTIYPNPAKDKITLQSSEEMAQVKIYDMFGKTIGTYQVSGLETTIGVDKLASGIYIAEITTINNGKAVKKFSITQ
ncbi:MAG TPA: T9SS type A sorting domain-containing protein, partial [Bacteroidales bacterium]|nr:T9SS type A sorting domain-containing protein [Bacteroidales bacterium]